MARAPRGTSSKASNDRSGKGAGSTEGASGAGRKARGGTKASGGTKAKSPTKVRGGSAARKQASKTPARATTRSPSKTRDAPQKRAGSKLQPRPRPEQSQSWVAALASLTTSPLARAILADVLEAAVVALRKQRPGLEALGSQQLARAEQAAADVGSELVAGTAALAQTAVGVLTGAVADTALSVLGASPAREDDRGGD